MEKGKRKVNFHSKIIQSFAYVPLPIREAAMELKNKPLWREIGNALSDIPIDETVSNTRLRNCIKDFVNNNNVEYLEIENVLGILEKEGYLKIERNSAPVYYLTSKFVQGLDFLDKLEDKTIRTIVKGLKTDEQFKKNPNLDAIVHSEVYTALEESIKA